MQIVIGLQLFVFDIYVDTENSINKAKAKGATMMDRKDFIERRKRERFKLKGGAFASVKSDHYKKIGSIRDINRDGFAFRYIGKEEQICGPLEVDILYSGSGLYVQKIKSKAIADFKTDKKLLSNSFAIRQCCVQFGELTEDQAAHLENFIRKYGHRRSGKDRRQFDDPGYSDFEILRTLNTAKL